MLSITLTHHNDVYLRYPFTKLIMSKETAKYLKTMWKSRNLKKIFPGILKISYTAVTRKSVALTLWELSSPHMT